MKKQYLISLLGLIAISIPMGNSLLNINSNDITPIYEEGGLDTGITISGDSVVKVLDNDHDGKASGGDTIDEIFFETTYLEPDPIEFKVIDPKNTGLNIYEFQNQEIPIWSESYYSITNLDADRHDGPELTIDVNSKDNPNSWLWDQELKDDSTKLIVTAEGVSAGSEETLDNLTENYIGEINISPILFELKPTIEITSSLPKVETTSDEAVVDYKITPGTDAEGNPVKYSLGTIEWMDGKNNNKPFTTEISNETCYDRITTGTITATNLVGDHPYTQTKLSANMVGDNNNTTIVSENISFITKTGQSNSIITDADASNEDKFTVDINYNISLGTNADNSPAVVEKIILTDDNPEAEKKTLYTSEDNELVQPDSNGDGTINVKDLQSDHLYTTTLTIETSDGSNPSKTEIEFETITAQENSIITDAGASNEDKFTVDINYNISLGTNADNSPAVVEKIILTDDNPEAEKKTLYTSEDNELVQPDSNGDGTINVKDLQSDHLYTTTLTIETSDGSNPSKTEIEFETITAQENSIITDAGASNEDKFTVDINYNISLGTNADNSPAVVEKIILTDDNPEAEKKTLYTSEDNELVQPDSNGDGTINVKDLQSDHLYTTTLTIETSDGSNPSKTEIEFETITAQENSTINSASASNEDKFTVDINYNISLGTNADNSPAVVEKIILTDDNPEAEKKTLYTSEDNELVQPDSNGDGTINVKDLQSDHLYTTTLTIETSDGSNPTETGIEFETITAQEDSIITVNNVVPGDTFATINYNVELGKTSENDDVTFDKAEWIDTNTGTSIAVDETPEPIKGITYSLKTNQELTSNTPYNTKLVLTLSGVEQQKKDITFTTDPSENATDPTISSTIDETKTTETSVTFDYIATPGEDSHGQSYYLAQIQIVDSDGKPMETLGKEDATSKEALDLIGSITVDDLEDGTTYEDWTIKATFIDSDGSLKEDAEDFPIPPFTTIKGELGAWTIIGIIIGLLLLIGIIAWIGNILYKKAKENKINIEIDKAIKQ